MRVRTDRVEGLSERAMFRALLSRDTAYDGVFVAAIRTTGVFCRPGCGARKPRRENVEFFATPRAALHAGYRPCRRCRPLEPGVTPPAWVAQALALADRTLDRRVTADELRRLNIAPSRLARWFKGHYGMTYQAYHRARRVGTALQGVRAGGEVLPTALRRGFDSERGLRRAFERLFGAPPTRAAVGDARVWQARWMPTPLGPMLAIADESGVALLEFVDRRALEAQVRRLSRRLPGVVLPGDNPVLNRLATELREYFADGSHEFRVTPLLAGSPFQQQVWEELRRIPAGATCSYGELARRIGRPSAVRAVARANGDNRIALLVPCHRVIGADGRPVGYAGGIWRKQWLLAHERGETPAIVPAE